MTHIQIQQFRETLATASSRKDDRRSYTREAVSCSQSRRQSRSRSPTRGHRPQRQRSPGVARPRQQSPAGATKHSFQGGASSQGPSACAVCLGRHRHEISKCAADTLWDGSKIRCKQNEQGRIINPNGLIICSDWQRPSGCQNNGSTHHHECSGCGKTTHGAQDCSRAQKN